MFEKITNTDERGQVGIGTLIVFIAMVLVAAIAAGVLINTAGVLQTQASNTGSETQEQVANQIEVLHASGNVGVDSDESGTVESVDMTLMKSAGSNEIDLRSMTVQYTSASTDKTLTYGDEANTSYFTTTELSGDNGGTSLTTKDDRVELTLDTQMIENDVGEGTILISGSSTLDSAEIEIGPADSSSDIVFSVDTNGNTYSGETITVNNDNGDDGIATLSDPSDGDEIRVDADDFGEEDTLTIDYSGAGTASPDSIDYNLPSDAKGLSPGSSATVALTDQSGAQFTYGISVPSTFGTSSVVEV